MARTGVRETLRVYDDLSYRRYLKSTAVHDVRELSFDEISQSEYEAIKAFFQARKTASGSDDQFYVYDPNVVNAVDLTGTSATGRHLAIFLSDEISFTRDGPCSYSGSVTVLFLN